MGNYIRAGLALLLLPVLPAQATDKPVWELGAGLSFLSFSDYIGSTERNNLLLPFPYVTYHSTVLDIDRDSLRSRLFDSERLRLELSLSGSIPVDSDDNATRAGMPDLDPIIEVGPSLQYEVYHHDTNNGRVLLELPLRKALASDFRQVEDVGWISNPNIKYSRREYNTDGTWSLEATLGPLFGDEQYHEYFYGVDTRYANADRPAYAADGGYGGWRFSVGFSRRVNDLWYGGFVRYIDISGATFADSPLVEQEHSLIGGLAVAWIFAKSAALQNGH